MDGMTLDSLSAEELTALEEAIAKRKSAQSENPMAAIASVCQMLLEKCEGLEKKLSQLETDFYQKVLGGIDGLYKENLRADGLKAFGEKHGPMFAPFADDFKRVFEKDLIPLVFDYLEELKGQDGYNDEMGDGKLKELAAQIQGRLAPKAPEASVEVTSVEAKPEETPAEKPAEEGPGDGITPDIENEIARMKRKDEARESAREKARTKGAA
ncbi:MAG: hypothetical protein LLG08_05635 [Actinomycetia bacterium]|nr:hypothetical protein [Actinomycetes bacterium]